MTRVRTAMVVLVTAATSCRRDAPAPAPEPPPAKPPVRGAVAETDLRVLLAEVAQARACDLVRGQFRPLRDAARPGVAIGVLWIRDCDLARRGTDLTLRLVGSGWQWADQRKQQAGGTFVFRQHVRFDVDQRLAGALDLAYDRPSHVVSMWFTPARAADVTFSPRGSFDVDARGAWSEIAGGLSNAFGDSPEQQAKAQAGRQGRHQFRTALADGLSVTIDLCSGVNRFGLGRPPKGTMVAPDVGEGFDVPFELQPGGLLALGPYPAPRGMTIDVAATGGPVRAAIACEADARRLVAAYLEERALPDIPVLAAGEVTGRATLRAKAARCAVAVLARPVLAQGPMASVRIRRPLAEAGRAAGGPAISCGRRSARAPRPAPPPPS
jgi:hypothetical protein